MGLPVISGEGLAPGGLAQAGFGKAANPSGAWKFWRPLPNIQ